jgi:hypothetical protein
MDHVFPSGNKKSEDGHGTHHGSSMWEEGEAGIRGEIVPGRFQMGHVSWVQVS